MDERDIEKIKEDSRLRKERLQENAKEILELKARIEYLQIEIDRYKYMVDDLFKNQTVLKENLLEKDGYIKGIDKILNKLSLGLEVEQLSQN